MLWDVDGTLVDVAGAGRRSFAKALAETWGIVDDLADVKFAGATDLMVLDQLRARLPLEAAREPAFFAAMARILDDEVRGAAGPHAIAGAVDVVNALRSRGVRQGLVTGNAALCARVKLARAGFDVDAFAFGAYGDEHADRLELAVRAVARSGVGAPATHAVLVLVGDTPMDMKAAKHVGAVAVGVVHRAFDREALLAAGADHVVGALVDVLAIVDAVSAIVKARL